MYIRRCPRDLRYFPEATSFNHRAMSLIFSFLIGTDVSDTRVYSLGFLLFRMIIITCVVYR